MSGSPNALSDFSRPSAKTRRAIRQCAPPPFPVNNSGWLIYLDSAIGFCANWGSDSASGAVLDGSFLLKDRPAAH